MPSNSSVSKPWYREAFDEFYPIVYAYRNREDAAKQVELILKTVPLDSGSKILDLCCGYGRHQKLFQAKNLNVFGLDLSKSLLKKNSCSRLVCGDIREIPFHETFDCVLNLFTSFGYFDDASNRKVFREIISTINPRGYFWLDYLNPYAVGSQPARTKELGECKITSKVKFDKGSSRAKKYIKININNHVVKEYCEDLAIYSPAWFEEQAKLNKLKINKIFGDYTGNSYNKNSPRLIYLYQKI